MPITALPASPLESDPTDVFEIKAIALAAALALLVTEANALEVNVNLKEANVIAAAATALAASTYKGEWSAQAGALNKPASVSHNGIFWALKNNLANVALSQPSSSSGDWIAIPFAALPNAIINGGMQIDQINDGAAVNLSASVQYPVDCFGAQMIGSGHTAQRSTDVPAGQGFSRSLKVTVGVGAAPAAGDLNLLRQGIEGLQAARFGFSAAGAQSVTIGFWVKCSLTGNFGVSLVNGASNRSYPSQYAVAAANTWEYKTVTIPGDTAGTWTTDNTAWGYLGFDLGSGTTYQGGLNAWAASGARRVAGQTILRATTGATLYITGVRLVAGSADSPFEQLPYADVLAACQRYTPVWRGAQDLGMGFCYSSGSHLISLPLHVEARADITGLGISNLSHFSVFNETGNVGPTTGISVGAPGRKGIRLVVTSGVGAPTTSGSNPTNLVASNSLAVLYGTGAQL